MTEAEFRRWFVEICRGKFVKIQAIESHGTGLGIPDIFFRTTEIDGWMELKQAKVKLGTTTKIPFRPLQYQWLLNYTNIGGNAILTCLYKSAGSNCVAFFRGHDIKQEYEYDEFFSLAYFYKPVSTICYNELIQSLSGSLNL